MDRQEAKGRSVESIALSSSCGSNIANWDEKNNRIGWIVGGKRTLDRHGGLFLEYSCDILLHLSRMNAGPFGSSDLVTLAPYGKCSHESCPGCKRPANRDSAPRHYHSQRCARQDQTQEIDSSSESIQDQHQEEKGHMTVGVEPRRNCPDAIASRPRRIDPITKRKNCIQIIEFRSIGFSVSCSMFQNGTN